MHQAEASIAVVISFIIRVESLVSGWKVIILSLTHHSAPISLNIHSPVFSYLRLSLSVRTTKYIYYPIQFNRLSSVAVKARPLKRSGSFHRLTFSPSRIIRTTNNCPNHGAEVSNGNVPLRLPAIGPEVTQEASPIFVRYQSRTSLLNTSSSPGSPIHILA